MQNDYKELWCLVNWTKVGHLGDFLGYASHYVSPLQQGQKANASPYELQLVRLGPSLLHSLLRAFVSSPGFRVSLQQQECSAGVDK